MADTDTSMNLTGVYSGMKMSATGTGGTISIGSAATARIGYKIASSQTSEGKPYSIVSVNSEAGVAEPPSVIVSVNYDQQIEIGEVNLDVKYTDIPTGTSLQVQCSEPTFNISKQSISGSSLVGSSGKEIGPFSASIDINLWISNPDAIKKTSGLTMSLFKIDGGIGAPVKKVLLEKIEAKLSN